jgi:hypothetical protein
MAKIVPLLLLMVIALTGCALKVVPVAEGTAVVDTRHLTISKKTATVAMTVGCNEADLGSYGLLEGLASFAVEIENLGEKEIFFDLDSFVLVDDAMRQYKPLGPEKVRDIMTRDSYYLLPYPYVGFYYLEDYERSAFSNAASSNLPYYYDVRPQDLHLRALPEGGIIPRAKVGGLLYFHADLQALKSVTLRVYGKGEDKSVDPAFAFTFNIVK